MTRHLINSWTLSFTLKSRTYHLVEHNVQTQIATPHDIQKKTKNYMDYNKTLSMIASSSFGKIASDYHRIGCRTDYLCHHILFLGIIIVLPFCLTSSLILLFSLFSCSISLINCSNSLLCFSPTLMLTCLSSLEDWRISAISRFRI